MPAKPKEKGIRPQLIIYSTIIQVNMKETNYLQKWKKKNSLEFELAYWQRAVAIRAN